MTKFQTKKTDLRTNKPERSAHLQAACRSPREVKISQHDVARTKVCFVEDEAADAVVAAAYRVHHRWRLGAVPVSAAAFPPQQQSR